MKTNRSLLIYYKAIGYVGFKCYKYLCLRIIHPISSEHEIDGNHIRI